MLNLAALSKQNTFALQRTEACAGYWLENNIATVGFSDITSSIEHNPMTTASFYKRSGN